MKKIFYFAAAALCIVSCAKEQPSQDPAQVKPISFEAVITDASDTAFTKTQLEVLGEAKKYGKLTWTMNDEVTITEKTESQTKKQAIYYVSAVKTSGRALLSYKSGDVFTGQEAGFTATYGDVTKQYYDAEHPGSNCPMEGESSSTPTINSLPALEFHNTCAVVRLCVKSVGAVLNKVTIGDSELILNPTINISDSTYFFVAVPPMAETAKLEIKLGCINAILQKKETKALQLKANILHRVKITSKLEFEMEPLPGEFTIDKTGNKVQFSRGNVWTPDQTVTYKMEEKQYYYHTTKQSSTHDADGLHVINDDTKGLFYFTEYSTGTDKSDALKNIFAGWDLLTERSSGEWYYMANERTTTCTNKALATKGLGYWSTGTKEYTSSFFTKLEDGTTGTKGAKWAQIMVEAVKGKPVAGLLLFPDSFEWPADVYVPNRINDIKDPDDKQNTWGWAYTSTYSVDDFKKIEDAGCVFLPAAGRLHSQSNDVQNAIYNSDCKTLQGEGYGQYMADSDNDKYYFKFKHDAVIFAEDGGTYGKSLRFVLPVRRITKDTEDYVKDPNEEVISE